MTLKKGVLDPQGKTVERALNSLGFQEIKDVRVGKYIELSLPNDLTLEKAEDQLKQICEKLLSNTVIEDYRFELMDQKR